MPRKVRKIIAIFLCLSFLFNQSGLAQLVPSAGEGVAGELDISGHLLQLRNSFIQDKFRPLHLRYLSYDTLNNNFKLLLDKGDFNKGLSPKGTDPKAKGTDPDERLKESTKTLLNYFFIGISLPNSSFWVNLRPDSQKQIIDDDLAQTDVGKILLEADLQLKKDTAKFTSPENPEGKEYWNKLYQKAEELFSATNRGGSANLFGGGSENITIPTLTRPWIVPDEIIIRETPENAYIYKATLKVMLEEDYLAGDRGQGTGDRMRGSVDYTFKDPRLKELNEYSSQLIRELIIPKLTKDINSAKRYAPLRQVYYSLILAQWFKQRFYGKGGLYSWLIDQKNLNGLSSKIPWSKTTYFKEYQRSFKEGEYNIKEPVYTPFGQTIRSYMSGGMNLAIEMSPLAEPGKVTHSAASPVTTIGGNPTKDAPGGNNIGIKVTGGSVDDLGGSLVEIEKGQQLYLPKEPEPAIKPPEINKETSAQLGEVKKGASSPIDNPDNPNFIQKLLQRFGKGKQAQPKDLATSPSESTPGQIANPDPKIIRDTREAFSFTDASQDFSGVDLEHFVHAQYRLAQGTLSAETLRQLLNRLNLDSRLSGDSAYQAIYERLVDGNYTKQIIDLINGDTYADPRLGIEIIGQNPNPRTQGVYEAVANSLDALGFSIGQFGKGVKQIIDWLESTGQDRIDVFTRAKSKDGRLGQPYQLSILRDRQGQYYIQLRKVTSQTFKQATGESVEQGTVVQVTTKAHIPRTNEELDPIHRNSQAGIADGIHRRFAYVPSVNITTQIGEGQPQQVNGFGEKIVIVPANAPAYTPTERHDRNISVIFSNNTIVVVDNGSGMNAETLARMFVPKRGTKHPEPLHGGAARAELARVKVVADRSLPHRVSFSRNGEIVVAMDISPDIQDNATMPGGLMIEFGSLLDVPESRDNIRIPLDLKPGEISNFQLAVEYAINQIIKHPSLSDLDKVRYANTIIAGLDGLIQGNPNYGHVIRAIRSKAQTALSNTIAQLRQRGFIALPHNRQFEKIAIPEGKQALFMHEHLFNWQGAVSLKELGGEIVPGITLNGEERLPLVVVAFTPESLQGIEQFNPQWHTWPEAKRLPIIRTDRFVAIPLQLGKRLNELAVKRASSPLTKEEEEEFTSLAQLINTLTASKVSTSYEVTQVEQQMAIMPVAELQRSKGEIDSQAINNFLTKSPAITGGRQPEAKSIPANANQRHILLANGDVVEVGTGRSLLSNAEELIPLTNGFYKVKTTHPQQPGKIVPLGTHWYELVKLDVSLKVFLSIPESEGDIIISPDKKWAYRQHSIGLLAGEVLDLESGTFYDLRNFIPIIGALSISEDLLFTGKHSNLQFSRDGKYLTYLQDHTNVTGGPHSAGLITIDLEKKKMINTMSVREGSEIRSMGDIEYALNPFANVAFVRDKSSGRLSLLDLTVGLVSMGAKHLHTDSSGTYTVIVDTNGQISIYVHKSKRILSARDLGGEIIVSVITRWNNVHPTFIAVVLSQGERAFRTFDPDSAIVGAISSLGPLQGQEFDEGFNWEGKYLFSSSQAKVSRQIDNIDPLQRLNQKGGYKHPGFGLFIDNSDPELPVAIDPRTGNRFPYEGEIVLYDSEDQYLQYHYNGEFVARSYQGPIVGMTQMGNGLLDSSGRFAVYRPSRIPPRPYYLHDRYSNSQGVVLSNIPLDHRAASFDGKYFVFVNPESGDVVYLDPEHPDQPIPVPKAQSAQAIEQVSPFLNTLPADAPNRYIIAQGSDGKPALMDAKDGGFFNIPYPVTRVERVNSKTFITYSEQGLASIIVIRDDNSDYDTLYLMLPHEIGQYSVVAHNERLVVIEGPFIFGDIKHQRVLDVITHKWYPSSLPYQTPMTSSSPISSPMGGSINEKASQAVHLSASGGYSVHKNMDGRLVYYDHDEAAPKPKLIARAGEYQEYLVSDRADAVIIKWHNDTYSIYSLRHGEFLFEHRKHIEIDSSGTIAIGLSQAGLAYVNLKTEQQGGPTPSFLRVSSDNERVYVSYGDDAGVTVRFFDKESGLYLGGQGGYEGLPRFWEQYDTEKKTIWDRQLHNTPLFLIMQGLPSTVSYQDNPPTRPWKNTIELLNERLIYYYIDVSKGLKTLRHFVDLVQRTSQSYNYKEFLPVFLKGKRVWRTISDDRHHVSILTDDARSYYFANTFINQSETFLLGQDKDVLILIGSQGKRISIRAYLPSGFIPTDVNGEYFVFTNPQTGEVRYLDPHKVSPEARPEVTGPSSEEVRRAMELWNNSILAKRDQWIAQARALYQPFLTLVPEEYRGEVERLIKQAIEQIYQQQEQEIQRRFQHSLETGRPLDLFTPLPLDELRHRMNHIRQELEQFLAYGEEVISREEAQVRVKFYQNLFPVLFNIVVNRDLDITKLSAYALHAVALGWDISRQDQIDGAPLIAALYQALSQFRTGPALSIKDAMKILSFASHISSKGQEQHRILITQIKKLIPDVSDPSSPGFEATMTKRLALLTKLRESFQRVELSALVASLDNPEAYHNLGEAKAFAVFLSNEVEPVKEKARVILRGEDIPLPGQGVNISQIVNLELQRPNKRGPDEVMSIDYLLANLDNLPGSSKDGEDEILRNTTVQRESGAYTAEIAQNSRDATKGKRGTLEVDFYLQRAESGRSEYVEEARDNGTGALQEVALLIPKSTKAAGEQLDVTGFFGTGKYTIFEGVDRVEIITKNQDRAYEFIFTVFKGNGQATAIKLTGLRRLTDSNLAQGVTVRRIKMADNTVPELDQMLAQRSWKTFAGLAQYEAGQDFAIYFIDHEGNRQKLDVEHSLLSQTEFRAVKVGEQRETNFGTMRIISTKDMPLQVVDKAGLRVKEIPEEYLALIPAPLRKHIRQLSVNIQIPLPLIRGRSAFEHETEYLPIIQRYVAIELYKAIAYKTLTQTTPQFVFENFPLDWETNDHYWDSINLQDGEIANMAERINKGRYEAVTEQQLQTLLVKPGELDRTKKFTKLLLLLEVDTPSGRMSLLLRRLAIQQELNAARAARQADMLKGLGFNMGATPDISTVPNFEARLRQGRVIETGHEQMRHPEQYIIDPSQYNTQEQKLVKLALSIAKSLGLEQVLLVSNEVQFAGAFVRYQGKETMLLTRSLANSIGQGDARHAILDKTTDTINHELAHFLEELMRFSQQEQVWVEGFVSHGANFTHDAVGTFAEAMKYVAGVWLAARAPASSPLAESKKAASSLLGEVSQEASSRRGFLKGAAMVALFLLTPLARVAGVELVNTYTASVSWPKLKQQERGITITLNLGGTVRTFQVGYLERLPPIPDIDISIPTSMDDKPVVYIIYKDEDSGGQVKFVPVSDLEKGPQTVGFTFSDTLHLLGEGIISFTLDKDKLKIESLGVLTKGSEGPVKTSASSPLASSPVASRRNFVKGALVALGVLGLSSIWPVTTLTAVAEISRGIPAKAGGEVVKHIRGSEWRLLPGNPYAPSGKNSLFQAMHNARGGATGGFGNELTPQDITYRLGMFTEQADAQDVENLLQQYQGEIQQDQRLLRALREVIKDKRVFIALKAFLREGGKVRAWPDSGRYNHITRVISIGMDGDDSERQKSSLHETLHYINDKIDSVLWESEADHFVIAPLEERLLIIQLIREGRLPLDKRIESLQGTTIRGKLGDKIGALLTQRDLKGIEGLLTSEEAYLNYVHSGMVGHLSSVEKSMSTRNFTLELSTNLTLIFREDKSITATTSVTIDNDRGHISITSATKDIKKFSVDKLLATGAIPKEDEQRVKDFIEAHRQDPNNSRAYILAPEQIQDLAHLYAYNANILFSSLRLAIVLARQYAMTLEEVYQTPEYKGTFLKFLQEFSSKLQNNPQINLRQTANDIVNDLLKSSGYGSSSSPIGQYASASSPMGKSDKAGASSPLTEDSEVSPAVINQSLLEQFYRVLLSLSDSKDLDSARAEWELYRVEYLDTRVKCRFNHNIRWRLTFRNKKTGNIITDLGPEEVIDTLKLTTKEQLEEFKLESNKWGQWVRVINHFQNFLTADQRAQLEQLHSRPFLTKDDSSIITQLHTQLLPTIDEYEQVMKLLKILDMSSMTKRYLLPREENLLRRLRRRLSDEVVLEPMGEEEKQIVNNLRKKLEAIQAFLSRSRSVWARRSGGKKSGTATLSEEMFDVESASLANHYFALMYASRIREGGMQIMDFGAGRSGLYAKVDSYGEMPDTSLVLDVDLEESGILEGENPHKIVIDENGTTILAEPEEFEHIPYDARERESTYDLIITNFVLDQLTPEQIKHFFAMALRLLKTDGELAVGLPRTKSPAKSLLEALRSMGWVVIHNSEEKVLLSEAKYKQVRQDEGEEVAEDLKHLVERTFHIFILKKASNATDAVPSDLDAELFVLNSPKIEKGESQSAKEFPLDLSRINALHILAEGLYVDGIRIANGHYVDRETLEARHNHKIEERVFVLATVVSLLPKRKQREALQIISAWYNLERRYFPSDFLEAINSLLNEFQGGISVAILGK